jgi:hypothetical protein
MHGSSDRVAPIDMDDPSELPCILIYARDDKRNPDTDYGPEGDPAGIHAGPGIGPGGLQALKESPADQGAGVRHG